MYASSVAATLGVSNITFLGADLTMDSMLARDTCHGNAPRTKLAPGSQVEACVN